MKKMLSVDKLETKEIILILQSILLGATITGRGVLWFTRPESVLHDSPFYLALHEIMPIWLWGLIVMVTGIIYTSSALFVTSMEHSIKYHLVSFVGGGTSAIFYFIMTSAGMYNNLNWLTPFNFLILTVWTGVLAFIGGAEIYARRK
ncbi:hypothetical protein [Staphylococcus edaphicus]|uniref:Uncharacterized protein n=1 Tax=Staphylococcus edaphicus TaxID=1955013 RepID=A0A2C6WSP5_9STAP|nr:hypothetical protein [Staphylococcus edaphicus]PHK50804.1 hypothetical protein BTJ66_00425 [Staphylococcus edaphicus]UQW82499.1 hypothetical protein MNY58_05390 [Staphylococcus edaphicus]